MTALVQKFGAVLPTSTEFSARKEQNGRSKIQNTIVLISPQILLEQEGCTIWPF